MLLFQNVLRFQFSCYDLLFTKRFMIKSLSKIYLEKYHSARLAYSFQMFSLFPSTNCESSHAEHTVARPVKFSIMKGNVYLKVSLCLLKAYIIHFIWYL